MKTQHGLSYVMIVIGLLCLAFVGGVHINSAIAQSNPPTPNDDSGPIAPGPGSASQFPPPEMRPGGGGGMEGRMLMAYGPATVAANSSYVYVLRGSTVYQLRASDLSLISQRDLPPPRRIHSEQNGRDK